ncbi:integrator complex subunit 8-like isoform X2 [Pollicipes pollicipes]|nr:integrator complex subunit 8-like isoform X1 [Pollicipes pollicipes]XP_037077246.1 integrator complex subunit 8-like isoform X2 [Pollicipes pollicipes]
MIKCCSTLHCYTQAAVLCQFLDEVDYASAFQYVAERNCADAMDAYYDCIWDMTLLEYLTHLHHKRSERDKRQQVIRLIGQLELNSNNNEEIQREAAGVRKARFLRAMVKQYAA